VALGRAQDFAFTATVDAGARDGVRRDQTVLSGSGLVGRVRAVGSGSATVLLAADPGSAVAVRLERTMDIGVAKGNGDDPAALELLNPSRVVVKGDRLVTFGSPGGSPYVPGVPYGEVVSVSRRPGGLTTRASVTPFVDFGRLDLVGVVIAAPRTDPRDSVLPPRPRTPGAATGAGAR
jgi:rod shape-determining protein MreC